MELQAYKNALMFDNEHPLSSEALKIDCVVIKKTKDVAIKKNIAAIFRNWNILEYKRPGVSVSVDDFYKVYAYACLYKSFEKVPVTDLTVSFVESRYPRKLFEHLKKARGYKVAETSPGIYTVSGDILPIQVIDSQRLPLEENLWLKSLSNKLDLNVFKKVTKEIARQWKAVNIGAYLETILWANYRMIQEAIGMDVVMQTYEKLFEKVGWTAKWEARGKAEGKAQEALAIAKNLVDLGLPAETVISATRLDPERVKALYQHSS